MYISNCIGKIADKLVRTYFFYELQNDNICIWFMYSVHILFFQYHWWSFIDKYIMTNAVYSLNIRVCHKSYTQNFQFNPNNFYSYFKIYFLKCLTLKSFSKFIILSKLQSIFEKWKILMSISIGCIAYYNIIIFN